MKLMMCEGHEKEYLREKYLHYKHGDHNEKECASTYAEAYYKELPMCMDGEKDGKKDSEKGGEKDGEKQSKGGDGSDVAGGLPQVGNLVSTVLGATGGVPVAGVVPGTRVKRDDDPHKEMHCAESYEDAYFRDMIMCPDAENLHYKHDDHEEDKKCAFTYEDAYYKQLLMCKDYEMLHGKHESKGGDNGDDGDTNTELLNKILGLEKRQGSKYSPPPHNVSSC